MLEQIGNDPSRWDGTHIQFIPTGIVKGQKTSRWNIESKYGGFLGEIKWFAKWRKYSFFPEPDCIFEETCMRDLSQFIEDRTLEHKAGI